jgi:enamine deaminase RidA (YjgF/YER057c/UK114 family)
MPEGNVARKLKELGIVLPPPPAPRGWYLPAVVHGGYAWVSGMLPLRDDKLVAEGLVDADVKVPVAKQAARLAMMNSLSSLNAALGGLDRVERVVRVAVYVASSEGFTSQPDVANGASELLTNVFGEEGRHARVAMGAARLPLNSPVEVGLQVALR